MVFCYIYVMSVLLIFPDTSSTLMHIIPIIYDSCKICNRYIHIYSNDVGGDT